MKDSFGNHREIESQLKSKRILYRSSEVPVRFAFEKELREHNKTKRMFPEINPYCEVYQFRDNMYGIFSESMDGMGDPWSYVIIGPEKAMLIDTGFGVGDLKGLVEAILPRKMELIVVNTHSHFDHAYGNCQFDRVYAHEAEVPALLSKRNPHIWDYLFDEEGNCIWTEFDRADIVPFKEYEIIGCPDGHIFNLGGDYEIELMFYPGHTCGHAAYLDKQNRILFAGDQCICGSLSIGGGAPDDPYRKNASITALYKELCKIVSRMDEFDSVFPGHGVLDVSPEMLLNIKDACERVLKDPTKCDKVTEREMHGKKMVRYNTMVFLSGYLSYGPDQI